MTISTRDLSALPDLNRLETLCKSIAMLDALVWPEWQYRYFSFNSKWDLPKQERMASMRNGSGDEYFLLFSADGAILKGFDHESGMSPWKSDPVRAWPGVIDHVPATFGSFLTEPAFNIGHVTFCIWRSELDTSWIRGPVSFPDGDDPDGSEDLLFIFDSNPKTYANFAFEYYEQTVSLEAVGSLYEMLPLTPSLVSKFNTPTDWDAVLKDAEEIGYPVSPRG